MVDQELPYESISFESPKKFIKTLKDILKNELPKHKIDFILKPFNASDKGSNYKNIKTLKKALPLGSKEIIRSVKELNIEERSELEKSLQKEIYEIALSRASGEPLSGHGLMVFQVQKICKMHIESLNQKLKLKTLSGLRLMKILISR